MKNEKKTEPTSVEDALQKTARHVEELAEIAGRHAESVAAQGKAKAAQVGAEVAGAGRDLASEADYYVHANPWKAIGIAAGLGVIAGLMLGRR